MRFRNIMLAFAAVAGLSGPAAADGGLTFIVSGDTFDQPFTIINTSTAGETVIGFGLKLLPPFGFDTVDGGFGVDASLPFTMMGGSGVATGYTGPTSFADGVGALAFTFTNFTVGKSFSWSIDVDSPGVATVFGNELLGASVYVDFSNGTRGTGVLEAIAGDPEGTRLVIRSLGGVPEPATWALLIAGFGMIGVSLRRRTMALAA